MKVGKVGTGLPLSDEGLVFADLGGGRRRGRKDDGGDVVFAEMMAIGVAAAPTDAAAALADMRPP